VVLFFLSRTNHCFSKNASNFAPDSTDKIYPEFSSDSDHMLFLYFEKRIEECLRKEWRKKHSFIFPLINADVVKDRLGGEHLKQSDLLKI